ncbi:hypothetical protein [Kitasatospora sp. NPDC059571]
MGGRGRVGPPPPGGGDRSQTVAALRQLLPWLVSQGYTFDFPAAD